MRPSRFTKEQIIGVMAANYGVGSLAARPRRPRDKAKVEARVRFALGYILGRLRRQTFFSRAEANDALATMVDRLNVHVMRRLGVACELAAMIERHGKPGMIVSNHGTEFTRNAMPAWCRDSGFEWHFIAPGKANQA